MEVIAFVGPSGTGKSHRALLVAHNTQADAIIDDGLYIKDGKILAGSSAKKEQNKVLAVKRAIFVLPGHADEVRNAIENSQPKKILILGTSENMVIKIAKALRLPEISRFIHIEDIATQAEIDKARDHRLQQGKHVIPVPTIELKPHFSGYLVDSLSSLLKRNSESQRSRHRHLGEKSIVRPVFSYCGKLVIEDSAIEAIVRKILLDSGSVNKVVLAEVRHIYKGDGAVGYESQGIELNCDVIISFGKHIPTLVQQLQAMVKKEVENLTGMAVKKVNITIKALFVHPKKV
ncbi:MAG: Asp23/Gls24 family envelope stress response protein [Anaerovibrio sp.]|uniref:Asp23/Gls24 family envelope stress response protein n=1 Tax=Anaerovibrio sp. TaxID=1872532 RepID=UPI0025DCC93A|nr:Asp23/Gls24 family envelope stress response protein [Anaerovibrio sp.]MCR5176710.1 Asp23/Gls24 family envelope stress response protein [Anaerovibrio sp.]